MRSQKRKAGRTRTLRRRKVRRLRVHPSTPQRKRKGRESEAGGERRGRSGRAREDRKADRASESAARDAREPEKEKTVEDATAREATAAETAAAVPVQAEAAATTETPVPLLPLPQGFAEVAPGPSWQPFQQQQQLKQSSQELQQQGPDQPQQEQQQDPEQDLEQEQNLKAQLLQLQQHLQLLLQQELTHEQQINARQQLKWLQQQETLTEDQLQEQQQQLQLLLLQQQQKLQQQLLQVRQQQHGMTPLQLQEQKKKMLQQQQEKEQQLQQQQKKQRQMLQKEQHQQQQIDAAMEIASNIMSQVPAAARDASPPDTAPQPQQFPAAPKRPAPEAEPGPELSQKPQTSRRLREEPKASIAHRLAALAESAQRQAEREAGPSTGKASTSPTAEAAVAPEPGDSDARQEEALLPDSPEGDDDAGMEATLPPEPKLPSFAQAVVADNLSRELPGTGQAPPQSLTSMLEAAVSPTEEHRLLLKKPRQLLPPHQLSGASSGIAATTRMEQVATREVAVELAVAQPARKAILAMSAAAADKMPPLPPSPGDAEREPSPTQPMPSAPAAMPPQEPSPTQPTQSAPGAMPPQAPTAPAAASTAGATASTANVLAAATAMPAAPPAPVGARPSLHPRPLSLHPSPRPPQTSAVAAAPQAPLAKPAGGSPTAQAAAASGMFQVPASSSTAPPPAVYSACAAERPGMALVLDVDGTLVHAIKASEFPCPLDVEPYVNERDERELFEWHAPGGTHYVKLRPGVHAFLADLQPFFEMCIFSKGDRDYVNFILSIIDPARTIFPSHRVATREELDQAQMKNYRRVCQHPVNRTIAFDDNPRVWQDEGGQLTCIKAFPYVFLKEFGEQLQISLVGHRPGDALPRDRDAVLPSAARLFREIHRDVCGNGPQVGIRIAEQSAWTRVFRNLRMVILTNNTDPPGTARAAQRFGARIEAKVHPGLHLLIIPEPCPSCHHPAVHRARQLGIPRVISSWLTLCFATWSLQDPRPFLIDTAGRLTCSTWDIAARWHEMEGLPEPNLAKPDPAVFDLLERGRRRRLAAYAAAADAAAGGAGVAAAKAGDAAGRTSALRTAKADDVAGDRAVAVPKGGGALAPASAGDVWDDLEPSCAPDEDVVIDLG